MLINHMANLDDPGQGAGGWREDRRVALVVQQPFRQNDFPKFEIDALLKAGIQIDVYDLSPLMFPDRWAQSARISYPSGINYQAILSAAELKSLRGLLDRALLTICGTTTGHLSPGNLAVMREVSKSRTPYMIIYRNAIPNIDRVYARPGVALRWQRLNIRNSMINRLPLSVLGVRSADFVVRGGDASRIPMRLINAGTEEIWSFSESQQECRTDLDECPEIAETHTAVYLDQNFGYHPDPLEHPGQKPVDPGQVYPMLRRWFDRIEKETGLRVVIAGHPRANYDAFPDIFGAREITFGKTVRLVRQSSLVICHYSTAVNQAVWFKKPVNIIQLPELSKMVDMADAPNSLAKAIGKPVMDIRDPDAVDISNVMDINQEKYKKFMARYIVSSKSHGLGIAEIVARICEAQSANIDPRPNITEEPQAQELRT
jgi:hypothetical protein